MGKPTLENQMLNATALLSEQLGKRLSDVFLHTFGGSMPHFAALLDEAARLVIERIAMSDALYHDAEHTALVTLVAQDILQDCDFGRRSRPKTGSTSSWRPFATTSGICAASVMVTIGSGR
jgi:hypothetical protein